MRTEHDMKPDHARGPKFKVDVEGTIFDWDHDTITPEQIRSLAGLPADQAVMLIDADNSERQLTEGEVVELKPGMGFAKKVRFRRG